MIDLHTHTTASDGTLAPAGLVGYAAEKKLTGVSVTDHDTVEGLQEAIDASASLGIMFVPGIEISAETDDLPGSTLHILGYYINHADERFLKGVGVLQDARDERNPKIIQKLQALGIPITIEEVAEVAETGQIGRPHFARVLVDKGFVKSAGEAFGRYLQKGAAAYVDKFRFQPRAAIELIREAGGIPVLAHPATLACRSSGELEEYAKKLTGFGLMGIEVYYSDHSAKQAKLYSTLARRLGLLMTGGSDFHGATIKDIDLGTGRGGLNVPDRLLDELQKAHGIA